MVETVLGPVKLTNLGRILTHEHFALDFRKFYAAPPVNLKCYFDDKICLENAGLVKQYPYSSEYNIVFNDIDTHNAVLADVDQLKKFGGGTIVENTSHGLLRDISFMKHVSQASGIHVIAGTGHYVASTQTEATLNTSVEEMYDLILKEMTVECEGSPGVKAGFIGEVGSTWPIHDFEKKAIQATAAVQAQLGCPVSFHPGRNPKAPYEIIRLYLEAGGAAEKAIMSHLDRTLLKDEDLLEFSKSGCYCQMDLFGTECSYYQFSPTTDMPSDAQRLDKVMLIREEGRLDRVLLSHDIHTKHRLMAFGGHGFSHIYNNVLPKMLIKGFSQEDIDLITMKNPTTWLAM
ncbi:phosphotriesterase-related protein isoform X1 [Neodiprion virginianus]|uniref:phosphotriesterase-related protein isoform X1 n=1 Tax=Neodiprion fabricii TaxID=2872261 RepID=UPI001ED8D6BB|nr:phosphotriesterase-related protein isoform X1 [Neodiprion fabricii]XP_046626983.1 phosphotriesterase-related protein isoform X1 [Neodiprion virginianus]